MSDDAELTERRVHRSGIWRNRDFRMVWAGQALSEIGTGISQLAYPLLMLVLTGSPAQAGALSAVRALPFLFFGLPAGALADRWDRKRMMVCCDVGRAVLMASIPAALWLDRLTPGQDAVEGLRWMWRHTAIRSIAVIAAGLQVAISGVTLVVIVAARVTGASSLVTGLLLAAVGVGGVGGALLTPMVKRRWGFGRLLAVVWAQAGLWVLFAISPGLIFTGVVLALFAASMPMFGIPSHSYLLAATPDRLRGRITTSFSLLTWAPLRSAQLRPGSCLAASPRSSLPGVSPAG